MRVLLVSIDLEYSLAFAYLQAYAESRTTMSKQITFSTQILDPTRLGRYTDKNVEYFKLLAHIEQERPELICFSCYLWNHIPIVELSKLLRALYPNITLLVGGPEVVNENAAAAFLEKAPIDYVIRGEGEISFADFIESELNGTTKEAIHGLSYRQPSGVVHNPPRSPMHDLDDIPSPLLSGYIDLDLFHRLDANGTLIKGRYSRVILETYRGCYMQCTYCQWGNGGPTRFRFALERILAEIDYLLKNRVAMVNIVDAMFGYKKNIAKDILRGIIKAQRKHGTNTRFIGYHNQDYEDDEMLDLYREANFFPEIDLQSSNKDVLEKLGRGKWPSELFWQKREAFRRKQVPIHDASDLIIGLPGDTYETFCDSVDYFLERGIRVNLFQTSMLPGTPMIGQIDAEEIAYSPEAPRFIFKTKTMPTKDIIKARLLGHGTELFQQYPATTSIFMDRSQNHQKHSQLCEAFGQWLSGRGEIAYEIGQYNRDLQLLSYQQYAKQFLHEQILEWRQTEQNAFMDVFAFEAQLRQMFEHQESIPPQDSSVIEKAPWQYRFKLDERCKILEFNHYIHPAFPATRLLPIAVPEAIPVPDLQQMVPMHFFIVFFPMAPFFTVFPEETAALLQRSNGYFTLEECWQNYAPGATSPDSEVTGDILYLHKLGLLQADETHPQSATTDMKINSRA